ncbi:MAG TPA: TonB-dependent receptor [Thalassobaculum sp.]
MAIGLVTAVAAHAPAAVAATTPSVEDLRALSLEELANVEVISVFKRPQTLSRTPASVYVITRDDIRRSGALTLPEVLRLAPNLMVARMNSRDYAISSRGFNTFQLSNKLLVLIDGRSVYTPLHAGVFWDEQQVMLEDVERIEVISGPAGTVWGANAVNGVINVITRSSHDTQGGVAAVEGGSYQSRAAVRYGGSLGEIGAWRGYAMGLQTGETETSSGIGRDDGWQGRQAGFRTDLGVGRDEVTVQGDLYENTYDPDASNTGGNLLGRWTRDLGADSSVTVQGYYNHAVRQTPGVHDSLDTLDGEVRHNRRLGRRHQVVWGGGYRFTRETFDNDLNAFVLNPESDSLHIANLFTQDSIALTPAVQLTLGLKYEYSSVSGGEPLPSARLAWQVNDRHMLWTAVARAVRTPSRFDRELELPGLFEAAGDDFGSEELISYQIGYRGQPTDRLGLSATLYYHQYDELRIITVNENGLLQFDNAQSGNTRGLEAWGDYHVNNRWRLAAGLNVFRKDLDLDPDAVELALNQHQGNDPEHQIFLRSSFDVTDDVEFDALFRWIDSLPNPDIPEYAALDLRFAWQATERVELSLVGRNLLDSEHVETGNADEHGEIPRSVYVGAKLRF